MKHKICKSKAASVKYCLLCCDIGKEIGHILGKIVYLYQFHVRKQHAICYLLRICGAEHSLVGFLRDVLDEFISCCS